MAFLSMARRKSDDKRTAILEAAIQVVADDGAAATVGAIAKRAGVSHGSVFHYFENKADLLNAAYLALKRDMRATTRPDLPDDGDSMEHLRHLWTRASSRRLLARALRSTETRPSKLFRPSL